MDWIFFHSDIHFEELKTWWEFWGSTKIFSPGILSTTGVIVQKSGESLCAGWLYRSDSELGYIGFIIMNPKAKKEDRQGAIEFLFDVLHDLARKHGIKILFGSIENKSLVNRMEKIGYMLAGGSVNLILQL